MRGQPWSFLQEDGERSEGVLQWWVSLAETR